jgi:hypothetical protein
MTGRSRDNEEKYEEDGMEWKEREEELGRKQESGKRERKIGEREERQTNPADHDVSPSTVLHVLVDLLPHALRISDVTFVIDDETKVVGERFDGQVGPDPGESRMIVVFSEDEADVMLALDAEVLFE